MQAETDRWWPPSHRLLLFFSLALSLSVPHSLRSFSQASPLFLSLSSSSLSHHSFFSLHPPSLFIIPSHPRSSNVVSSVFLCLPLVSCIFSHLSVLSSHSFAPVPHHPSLTLSFHSLPHSLWCCTLPVCLPVGLFHKGLSEASALLIHSPCIASHICRVRQTVRERERGREEEICWKREVEGPRKEGMKKKRCSFISKKQKARARSCGGIFHNLSLSQTSLPWPPSALCLLCRLDPWCSAFSII